MDSASQTKPHVVCIPFPAQGHINPMMQLAKLLHSRGFYVTFVNTEFNHKRLIKSKGPDFLRGFSDFRFETIPDGLPDSDKDATQDAPLLCDSTSKNCLEPFCELLNKLNSFPELPAVSCLISDGVMSFAIKAAGMIGVPEVQFWTTSACGFMGYLQYEELIKRGIVPFKAKSSLLDPKMSSSDCGARRPHAVCVPYPTQGHVTPMMQLAKLLHSRGFYITFVNTHFNHKRLLRSKGPNFLEGFPDFQFQSIPDGLPDSDTLVNQDVPLLCDSTRKNCLGPFQVLLDKLNSRSSFASGVPPVTCIVSDGVMSFAIKAAEELGIPEFQLWTASTCSFMGYLHFEQLKKRGIIPFQGTSKMFTASHIVIFSP
ncbi:hypothetical protein RJ641_009976 [Dillenia turbinata]|uniref:Glycosyltransferase N-terminal domain-containing protein n=1 Tax=Dillenia turbinata TaxID=194707 RepID=A0AAN8Z3U6_9MAGN